MGGLPLRIARLLVLFGPLAILPSVSARASVPSVAPNASDEAVLQACGSGDPTLHGAARRVAERALDNKPAWSMVQLGHHLRAWGVPHPGARSWTLKAASVDRTVATDRLHRWLASHDGGVPRRCGVASVQDSARGEVLAVVVVPVYADLRSPLPPTVRQGSWVTVDVAMRQWADGAKVVVLGPRGAPRTIPTSYDRRQRRILARFMADHAGDWNVQVLASTRTGPRPVLESQLHVGTRPSAIASYVPGESAGLGLPDAEALFQKLNSARRSEGLRPLARDPVLDRVADDHVGRMMSTGLVVHDAGDGTPPERAADAGVRSSEVGENVSKAANPSLAHRVLWGSPSHRTNTLHPRYERVGVAARRDAQGRVWVTQLFAGR